MGNKNGVTPTAGVSASVRNPASPLRYVPASLASLLLIAIFLATDLPRGLEPWFFGLFLKGKGDPPISATTVIVSADPGGGPMDAQALARVAAAILERGPAVLALGPASGPDPDSSRLESLAGPDALPRGHLILSHSFSGFGPWAPSENAGLSYPPILARSLYPLLDGPEPGLSLPMGVGMDISDTAITKGSRAAGGQEPTTAFAAPRRGSGVFSVPAFLRLERGVVAGLGVEAARRWLGVPASKVGYVEGVGVLFNATHVLPIDARGEIPVRFHGPGGIPRIPAARFLEGRVSATEVQGKVVFVDPDLPGSPSGIRTAAGPRTATEIQASLTANFLDGTGVYAPSWSGALPVVLGLVFISIVLLALFLDLSAPAAFALAALLAVIYPLIAGIVFLKSSLWLPPELPGLMAAAAYLPFAITRLLSPAPRSGGRAQSIQPVSGYDPALVSVPSLGRQTPGSSMPVTPARGTPQMGQTGKLRAAPKERQGGTMTPSDQRPAAAAPFADPRDPPILPADATPDLPPAPRMPRSMAAAAVPAPAPAAPAAHAGSSADDIERDGKGGLVRVGKYRIVRKMGFGSGGDVFEGFDTHMGRKVAIKTITKNAPANFDRASERFVLEAKAAGSLNHPCINTIYDFGTIREVSYMVLEYLDGITLSQWMRNHPAPPRPLMVAHWLQQISSALDFAHGCRIIHRDLKPSNLMVVNSGATIKLLDFGIAKMEDVGLTQTGMTVGTPSYMSPEQLSGIRVGPASDQYGLAVVIYQLFTYKLPYIGTKIPELCNRILKNDIIPITDVDPSLGAPLWEALRKAMAKAPEDRYPNCMALSAALEAAFPDP